VGFVDDRVLLDDTSNVFQDLMESYIFRQATGCGFPRAAKTRGRGVLGRHRKKEVFATVDERSREHRIISVPKRLLEPYFGVRGKAGAQNYVVDLLRHRGWIFDAHTAQAAQSTWQESLAGPSMGGENENAIPKPRRYALYGIFDVRHQPHEDFWNKCMPAFLYHNSHSFDYEVNSDVALVQMPQSFASVRIVDDYLDVNNGLLFNMMNIIRNSVGGVTSCGTNGVWLLDTCQTFEGNGGEFFDSRCKIEDTASSHRQIIGGKRSVYVHKVVATGIAKLNAAYLGATQRWAEGAVQLFWIHFFIDRCKKLWGVLFAVLSMYAFLGWSLYTPSWHFFWCCPSAGMFEAMGLDPYQASSSCLRPLEGFFLTDPTQSVCMAVLEKFWDSKDTQWSDMYWLASSTNLVRWMDFGIWWFLLLLMAALVFLCLGPRRVPSIVRTIIMFENCTYFWSAPTVFVWVGLSAYMVIYASTPFRFEVFQWMSLSLIVQICKYIMQQRMKSVGKCDETSIWRSQQMFFVGSPLHIMSLVQGTISAYGIFKHGLDKSFWSATDHGVEVVNLVKAWTCTILGSCTVCVITLIGASIFWEVDSAQYMSGLLLFTMAITIWTPVLDIFGYTSKIEKWRRIKVQPLKFTGYNILITWDTWTWIKKWVAIFMFWGRSKSYMLRWVVDLGIPLACILLFSSGQNLLFLSAYAQSMGIMRV
jgi:hypothetical protein